MHTLTREQFIPAPVNDVFAFFSEAANLEEITPAWLGFRILTALPVRMAPGTLIEYRLSLYGIPVRWRTLITEWNPPFGFKDVQLSGPYKFWEHEHRFEAVEGGTRMRDTVRYELPFGPIGRLVERVWVRRDVARISAIAPRGSRRDGALAASGAERATSWSRLRAKLRVP